VTRRVVIYSTASLDGFIAEKDGGMSWLDDVEASGVDFSFADFYAGVQTLLMGRATYEFVLRAAEKFPHADREVIVFSSRELPRAAQSVRIVAEDAAEFTARLKATEGGTVWCVGGAQIDAALLDAGLVDEIRLFVQPVLLGDGIPLFATPHARAALVLDEVVERPLGIVELRYSVRRA
jgi:dihydrofolate reductase